MTKLHNYNDILFSLNSFNKLSCYTHHMNKNKPANSNTICYQSHIRFNVISEIAENSLFVVNTKINFILF